MRASALDHEVLDYSVEMQAIIESVIHQFEEISSGVRELFRIEFNIDFSCARRHPNISHEAKQKFQVQYGMLESITQLSSRVKFPLEVQAA